MFQVLLCGCSWSQMVAPEGRDGEAVCKVRVQNRMSPASSHICHHKEELYIPSGTRPAGLQYFASIS